MSSRSSVTCDIAPASENSPGTYPQVLREVHPHLAGRLALAVILYRLACVLAELLVGEHRARVADDREPLGEHPLQVEVEERGQQLALGQVAGGAEDDDRLRCRGPARHVSHAPWWSSAAPASSSVLHRMPAELVAERGDHLRAERLVLPRREPREQRQRRDRERGHPPRSPPPASTDPRPSRPRSPRMSARPGSFSSASCSSSSSHERTTLPYRQMPAISPRSRSNGDRSRISKPSPYAASSPYSIPLWTIFTKCPAPDGPTCAYPSSGASARKAGSTSATASVRRPPSGSSRSRVPTGRRSCRSRGSGCRRSASCSARRCESCQFELPPSTITSPFPRMPPSSRTVDFGDVAGRHHQPDDPGRA